MYSRLSVILTAAILLVAGLVFANGRPGRTGVRVIELPTTAEVGPSVDKLMLLETQGLSLTTVLVPERQVHNAATPSGYVTLQALSGSAEVLIGTDTERLDARHMVVVAPGVKYDVRAISGRDVVLLMHELSPARRTASSR